MAAITATDPLTTVNHMQGTDLDGLTDLLGLSWANVYPAGTAGLRDSGAHPPALPLLVDVAPSEAFEFPEPHPGRVED